jgi:dehydrogenase/reductase SDR family protein 12
VIHLRVALDHHHGKTMKILGRLLDDAMDWTVVPGFTKVGYGVRRRITPWERVDMRGRTAMVTGASAGIGEAACAGLAAAGAVVHMVVRDLGRGESARERIAAASGSERLVVHRCNVSSLASVRELAAGYLEQGDPLHVLVNNAGILPSTRSLTDEGFELTFATNVLGPFLLTALLLPALRRSAPARVLNVSSGGMYSAKIDVADPQLEESEFEGTRFYAHTKRAEVILSEEWGRRLAGDRIVVHSVHPGWVATAGVAESLPRFHKVMGPLLREPSAGADTIVWLAGAEEPALSSGDFWHDRRRRAKHRLPRTRETAVARAAFFDECERLCGLEPGAAVGAGTASTQEED